MTATARATDPAESHLAAAKIDTEHSQGIVKAVLHDFGPATDEQIYERSKRGGLFAPCTPSRMRGARCELCDAGQVRASRDEAGVLRKGRTVAGGRTQIWELVA